MSENGVCASYRGGNSFCKDGFPVSGYCRGYTCDVCGRPSKHIPLCLQDEIPEHLIDDAGRMRYRAPEGGNG